MTEKCRDNWCNLYNDVIAVCSFSDLCFPDTEPKQEPDGQDAIRE